MKRWMLILSVVAVVIIMAGCSNTTADKKTAGNVSGSIEKSINKNADEDTGAVNEKNQAGKGKLAYENIGTYEGEYTNNKPQGEGKLFSNEGILLYEGSFNDGKPSGRGKIYHNKGNLVFQGNVNGKFENTKGGSYKKVVFSGTLDGEFYRSSKKYMAGQLKGAFGVRKIDGELKGSLFLIKDRKAGFNQIEGLFKGYDIDMAFNGSIYDTKKRNFVNGDIDFKITTEKIYVSMTGNVYIYDDSYKLSERNIDFVKDIQTAFEIKINGKFIRKGKNVFVGLYDASKKYKGANVDLKLKGNFYDEYGVKTNIDCVYENNKLRGSFKQYDKKGRLIYQGKM